MARLFHSLSYNMEPTLTYVPLIVGNTTSSSETIIVLLNIDASECGYRTFLTSFAVMFIRNPFTAAF